MDLSRAGRLHRARAPGCKAALRAPLDSLLRPHFPCATLSWAPSFPPLPPPSLPSSLSAVTGTAQSPALSLLARLAWQPSPLGRHSCQTLPQIHPETRGRPISLQFPESFYFPVADTAIITAVIKHFKYATGLVPSSVFLNPRNLKKATRLG